MRKGCFKKLVASVVVMMMLISSIGTVGVLAEREYVAELSISGVTVGFESTPYNKYDTVFFPLEELCGYLNISIERSGETYTITRMGNTIKADIDNLVCELNGETLILESPITNRDGVVYASVELLEKGLDIPVTLSEDKHSADITPNIYYVYINEDNAAAISAGSPDKDTLAKGTDATDNLYYDNPTSPKMEKSLYYKIDLSDYKGKDIAKAELVTTIGRGNNSYPTLGMVRTELWDKATINYNNQPKEKEETIASKTLDASYLQNAKNFIPTYYDITSIVKSSMIEEGISSLKLLGAPYNHQTAETQVLVKGVNTPEAPYVKLTLNESYVFPTEKLEENDNEDDRYSTINLLRGIGIFTAEDEFPIDGNVPVSRSEFVTYAIRLRGENIPQGGTIQFFSDVPKEASYFSAVMSAQACGYISGEQGSSFRPDDAITISEAITILGRMLNYTMHAEQNGGYPLGYFDAAMKGGLYRGGNSETALLSFDRMIDLLEDSIDAAFLDEIAFTSNGGSHYTFNENKTILTEYWNARKIKGTVTANEYSDLSGSNGNDGFITIYDGSTSKRLAVKYEPYNEYLGYEVSGYYNDENELLYLGIIKNREIEISFSDISDITESSSGGTTTIKFHYEKANGGYSNESFTNNMVVIYNGKSVKRADIKKSLLSADNGTIKIVDDNLVIINAYRTVIVYQINYDTEIIYDVYEPYDNVIRLNNIDWFFKNTAGKELALENINNGDVISAAVSLDGKLVRGIVTNKKIEGKISSLENSGTDSVIITIAGNEFKTANRNKKWTDYIMLGTEGVFYLDAFNRIVGLETDKAKGNFGYIVAVGDAGRSSLDEKPQAAIVVQTSEEYKIYDFAKRVKIDGVLCKTCDEIEAAFKVDGAFKPQGIIFDLNNEGKINNVDTATLRTDYGETSEDTLYCRTTGTFEYKAHGEVSGKFNLDFSTGMVVYQYGEADDLDEYGTVKTLGNDFDLTNFEIYTIGKKSPVIKILKLTGDRTKPTINNSDALVVVDNVVFAYDEEDGVVQKMYYHSDAKGVKSIVVSSRYDDEFQTLNLDSGDIIRFSTYADGTLGNAEVAYKYNDGAGVIDSSYFSMDNWNKIGHTYGGYTTTVMDGFIRISDKPEYSEDDEYYAWLAYSRISGKLFKYEVNRNNVTVSEATLVDIRESEKVPYDPTGILVATGYTNIQGNVWLVNMAQPANTGIYKVMYQAGAEDDSIKDIPEGYVRYNMGDIVTITSAVPSRTDHDFTGWNVNGNVLFAGDTFSVAGDTTITATWAYNPTLTFNFVDEEGVLTPMTREWALNDLDGNSVVRRLPTAEEASADGFKKAGYKLAGWKLGGTTYLPGEDFTPTQGETFTAVWQECWSGTSSTLITDAPALVDGYYQIDSAEDLAWFSNLVNGKLKNADGTDVAANVNANAKLISDIYINYFDNYGSFDDEWYNTAENVANANSWYNYRIAGFKGIFDGNGKTIYGFYTKGNADATGGLFAKTTQATIKDFTMKGAYLVSTSDSNTKGLYLAPVVAQAEKGTVSGITTYGKMTVDPGCYLSSGGGIVGHAYSTVTVDNCNSYMNIDLTGSGTDVYKSSTITYKDDGTPKEDTAYSAKVGVGGIVGRAAASGGAPVIKNCTNYGEIYAPYNTRVGGVIGAICSSMTSPTNLDNLINNAQVTGAAYVSDAGISHVGKVAGYIRYFNAYIPADDATTGTGTVVFVD